MEPVVSVSLPNLRTYCDRHGYELVAFEAGGDDRRPRRGAELRLLLEHLDRFDWLFWTGPDTLFMDPAVPLAERTDPQADLMFGRHSDRTAPGRWRPRPAGAVEFDPGAFLVSNRSGRARPFLEAVAREVEGGGGDGTNGDEADDPFSRVIERGKHGVVVRYLEAGALGKGPADYRRGDFILRLDGHPGRVYVMRRHLGLLPGRAARGEQPQTASPTGPQAAQWPADPQTASDLAQALACHESGRAAEAEAACLRVLDRRPGHAPALHMLGLVRAAAGRFDDALELMCRAVQADPLVADFHGNLGAVLGRLGLEKEAVAPLQEAARLAPSRADAWENLGVALYEAGRHKQAAEAHRRALRLAPLRPEGHYHLGRALRKMDRAEEALASLRRAVELREDYFDAHHELSCAAGDCGRLDVLLPALRRAVALRPESATLHSNLLFCLLHEQGDDVEVTFAEHLEWARRHAEKLYPPRPPRFDNDRGADRPLRIGYVSPDYRQHPVAVFLEPAIEHHDRRAVAVYCYSDVAKPDPVTRRIRGLADAWRDVAGLPDQRVMELIRRDRIDVLIDLAGHTGDNRLSMFARRAAPVQASYLGYPSTTGLTTIDYRITDPHHDPPGMTERYYTERLWRLTHSAWCYRPADGCDEPGPLPADAAGGAVTFGSTNRPIKLTPRVIDLWARVLHAVPGSRMFVLVGAGDNGADYVGGEFARHGIGPDRVRLVGRSRTHLDYLRMYHEIDVLLDAFPYAGETTTFDAMWMGVPAVTLAGRTCVSRTGVNVLASAGLEDLVAATTDDYVRVAAGLARELGRLRELRATLRSRMARSPLGDGPGLARSLETAYRSMWAEWCGDGPHRALPGGFEDSHGEGAPALATLGER
jgi:predicted O-linked N-acetylglucosamine transferase (SPINDLY family)